MGDTYFLMLAGEWSEYGVTYNEYPAVIEGIVVRTEWSRQDWVAADCTEFVRLWYEGEVENNGILGMVSEGESECWYRVYSREYGDEGTNPRLLVEYSLAGPGDGDKTETPGSNEGDIATVKPAPGTGGDNGPD